jgi:phosphoribosylanthranilate isomerase
MSVEVKICGLSEAAHVDVAVNAGAALTGFVFFPRSPRNVTIEQAAALTARVPEGVRKVALTVNADDAFLAEIVADAGIDTLQLHGDEDAARVRAVRATFGLPVIKALPVSSAEDVAAHVYAEVADMLLFDAKPPADATRPGGNALTFDWDLLKGADFRVPWLLAGGLTPENVADAIRSTGAVMVDVSSGVEETPGHKSAEKIRAFIKAAHSA